MATSEKNQINSVNQVKKLFQKNIFSTALIAGFFKNATFAAVPYA